MKFAPLQGEFAAGIISGSPDLQSVDSLILVDTRDGAAPVVHVRSAAVLSVARYLGWPWKAALALRLVPTIVRDWGYNLFARNRHRCFGRYDACPLPTPEQRARFLA